MSYFMEQAIIEARKALEIDEVPVGAVVVFQNEIIGRGYNKRETTNNPTMHAEIIAIKEASHHLKSWRLIDCQLYVTLEPCPMCAGAIIQSRIERLVFGAFDPKAGCVATLYKLLEDLRFNHQTTVESGVLEEKCSILLKEFFKNKRGKTQSP